MGYTARSISLNARPFIEFLNVGGAVNWTKSGVAEETFWKQTYDLTNVDYLNVGVYGLGETGSGAEIIVYFDGVAKSTQSLPNGSLNWIQDTIDCTAITGSVTISVTVHGAIGLEGRVREFKLWHMEA